MTSRALLGVLGTVVFVAILGFSPSWALIAGERAPAFEATASDGATVKLSDFAGKTVVLEWTNYHCPFVRKFYDAGKMQALQQAYTEQDVVWLSIISSAPGKQGHLTPENADEAIMAEDGHATHVLLDEEGHIGLAYGAKTTPHMFVIAPEGTVAYGGAIDNIPSTKGEDIAGAENYVVKALDAVLDGQPVEMANTQSYGCSVKYGDS